MSKQARRAGSAQEAIPPNYDALIRGFRTLGYGEPTIEIGDLHMRSWVCLNDECNGGGNTYGGIVKQTCDVCAEPVEVGEEIVQPVAQVLFDENPIRRSVAGLCPIRRERVTGDGFEDLTPVGAEHVAICSAMAQALAVACSPESIRAGGQN